ncbi:hypothetical protein AMATHDRAFT_4957 [Amanita thiersii Skay4041]|uniref:DUF6533 domain-containing protein n=1 Tax=Amanita thiersii Skay4041 TaxID=703135 RepID=A0A2A9NNS7_9AGAR|nr:hypothetical protein AMATHDRAFT_4957 [Amanita thiersii Skay4041]
MPSFLTYCEPVVAASTILTLYDLSLCLDDEKYFVWVNITQKRVTKILYLMGRYVPIVFFAYTLYNSSSSDLGKVGYTGYIFCSMYSFLSNGLFRCMTFVAVNGIFNAMVVTVAQVTICLRFRKAWDDNKWISIFLKAVVIIYVSITVVFIVLTAKSATGNVKDISRKWTIELTINKKNRFMTILYGIMAILDASLLGCIALNSVARPYKKMSDVAQNLQHDGTLLFTTLFVFNLVATTLGLTSEFPYEYVLSTFQTTLAAIQAFRREEA